MRINGNNERIKTKTASYLIKTKGEFYRRKKLKLYNIGEMKSEEGDTKNDEAQTNITGIPRLTSS